ncbi:16S rRNA (adenine(1518)-N(6)/adenine(1519)-N(6))-dimethyltransferase RsmA [bacterium]|nr:16S rRNA (adenine(1518)-N(6)/adenine(1519)-N(6))-dimethyltransferase RsmA [bacterium]
MRLKKKFGQFLLRDEEAALRIASFVPTDIPTIEIGSGTGLLTTALLETGHNVIGVEIDLDMVERLEQKFNHRRDFRLIPEDILSVDWNEIAEKYDEITISGNLPYHLTSSILFSVFNQVRENKLIIKKMVVMIQKEVAVRICSQPGKRAVGAISVLTRYHGKPEYLFTVPSECFQPRPDVDGGVMQISFYESKDFPNVEYQFFRRVVRACFAQRRKMMRNALTVMESLPDNWKELDYDFTKRPEAFTFEEFVNLTKDLDRLNSK